MRSESIKSIPILAIAMSLFLTQGILVYFGIRNYGFIVCYGLLYYLTVSYYFSSRHKISNTGKNYIIVAGMLAAFWEKNIVFFFSWGLLPFLVDYINHMENQKKYYRKLFLIFFFIETTLGIYEKTIQTSFFPTFDLEEMIGGMGIELAGQTGFRATSLCGFPLANALIVSISMSFLLLYYKKMKFRLLIWFIGYWSLFAFNARGSILVWALITILFVIDYYKRTDMKSRIKTVCFVALFIPIMLNYLANSHWGGRLFHDEEILDGSAMTRISAFDYYNNLSVSTILMGINYSYPPTENGYLNLLIRYGLIGGMPFILCQFKLVWNYIRNRRNIEKWILLLAFIGVGQTNNALNQPSFIFMFCLCVSLFTKNINGKSFNYHSSVQ